MTTNDVPTEQSKAPKSKQKKSSQQKAQEKRDYSRTKYNNSHQRKRADYVKGGKPRKSSKISSAPKAGYASKSFLSHGSE